MNIFSLEHQNRLIKEFASKVVSTPRGDRGPIVSKYWRRIENMHSSGTFGDRRLLSMAMQAEEYEPELVLCLRWKRIKESYLEPSLRPSEATPRKYITPIKPKKEIHPPYVFLFGAGLIMTFIILPVGLFLIAYSVYLMMIRDVDEAGVESISELQEGHRKYEDILEKSNDKYGDSLRKNSVKQ